MERWGKFFEVIQVGDNFFVRPFRLCNIYKKYACPDILQGTPWLKDQPHF